MSESYTRNCKHCGRRIQMRQMPHGQWVAFEGYDTVHDCQKPPVQIKYSTKRFGQNDADSTDDFGFASFQIKPIPDQVIKPDDATKQNVVAYQYKIPKEENATRKATSKATNYDWIIWIIVLYVLFRIFFG